MARLALHFLWTELLSSIITFILRCLMQVKLRHSVLAESEIIAELS